MNVSISAKAKMGHETDVKMLKNILHSDENTEFKC